VRRRSDLMHRRRVARPAARCGKEQADPATGQLLASGDGTAAAGSRGAVGEEGKPIVFQGAQG
jgi:hypothetical protein